MTTWRPCVAIDGPVAAGKSTIARLVARELGLTYIDSGAMYRALAWAVRRDDIQLEDHSRLLNLLQQIEIELHPRPDGHNEIVVDGRDVTADIRSPEISQLASRLSAIPAVRRCLVALQRGMARSGKVVMEGRDIQTVVIPNAEVKIFLTAPVEERAQRRWKELTDRGHNADYDHVLSELKTRDERDATREDSPLRAAPDAVHVDTGGLTIDQVVDRVIQVVRDRCPTDE